MIGAVIFDLDGVLIDSEHIWEEVRRALVLAHDRTYPPDATRAVMGMSAPEWSHYIRVELGVDLPEPEINAAVVAGVGAAYRRDLPLMPGAVECVRRLAAARPLAVASSSNRSLIEQALVSAGIRDDFRAVVSAEEVPRGKPAPDVYLRAAALLGVVPERCAAVEDSSNGLRSAHAAKMRVIAIPNRDFPPAPDALALASVVIASLDALQLDIVDPGAV
jgi:HAD superfamily hydrolase (TIGR01509 family)